MSVLCYFDFFFFKQKTAYEMRISDWSSDVCSSDLDRIEAIVVFPVPGGPHSSRDIDWSPSINWRSGDPVARSCCWPTSSSSVRGRIQIGRASCRERVCQYV